MSRKTGRFRFSLKLKSKSCTDLLHSSKSSSPLNSTNYDFSSMLSQPCVTDIDIDETPSKLFRSTKELKRGRSVPLSGKLFSSLANLLISYILILYYAVSYNIILCITMVSFTLNYKL